MCALLLVLSAVSIISVVLLIFALQNAGSLKEQVRDLNNNIETNTQQVYVAMDDLPRGTVLAEDVNVMKQENLTGLPKEMYLQPDSIGSILLVDVDAYTPIMASMAAKEAIDNDTREYEIGAACLMVDQKINDYVDIRILFPTGEDYIVASKVRIKNLLLQNSIFYANLSEAEILTLSSATVDAYTMPGTKLYVTRYLSGSLQEKAIPNYPVRGETIALMSTDPNVLAVAKQTLNLAARQSLEQKLENLTQDHLDMVTDGIDSVTSNIDKAIRDQDAEKYGEDY